MPRIPASLRALLARLIDYAGLYPPAGLPLPAVLENYQTYIDSVEAWMLNRIVLPAARLAEARLREGWRVTLLVDSEPGPLPAQVETLETRLSHRLSLPTYCEAPIGAIQGAFAKLRTGGLTPEAIPQPEVLADFLCAAAARRMAFKATAGLHHPIRATMHGEDGSLHLSMAQELLIRELDEPLVFKAPSWANREKPSGARNGSA